MKKVLTGLLVAAAVLGLTFNQAEAAKKYTLRIGTSQTDQALITRTYAELAKRLNERSGGRLDVRVFSSNQLGTDEDMIEQGVQGAPVALNSDAARMSNYVKDIAIILMPYFADTYDECLKVTETDIFKGWVEELASKHGIRVIAFNFYDGPRHFMTNKEVKTPADLNGLRIRTMGSEVCTEAIKAMGGTPIAMPWGEVYNAVQSGAIDGLEAQNTSTLPSKIYEVAKIQSKTGHFQLMQAFVCGEKWFKSIPEDLQKLILDTAKEVGEEGARQVLVEADQAEAEMVKAGLKVVEPDIAAFKEATKPVYDKLGFTELRKALYKEIGKAE